MEAGEVMADSDVNMESMTKELHEVAKIVTMYLYPLKSGRGIEVESAEFTSLGLKCGNIRDRSFVVVDVEKRIYVTCYQEATIQRIAPTIENDNELWLDAPGKNTLKIYIDELTNKNLHKQSLKFKVLDQDAYGIDCGDWAASWFSSFLGRSVRLYYYSEDLKPKYCKKNERYLSLPNQKDTDTSVYANFTPYMMASQSSLEDIQRRYNKWLGMRRFRPNIVVDGAPPYSEDSWRSICINDGIWLRNIKPCQRCPNITIDPESGIRDKNMQPLKFMRSFRKASDPEIRNFTKEQPLMGINLMIDRSGRASVGDKVEVIYKS